MQKYKKLNEANELELRKIYNENKKLQVGMEEKAVEDDEEYLVEVLRHFNKVGADVEWEISYYHHNYFSVSDDSIARFVEGLKLINVIYGVFCNEEELINNLEKLNDRLYEMDYDNKQYDNLEGKVLELKEELEGAILSRIDEILDCRHIEEQAEELFLGGYEFFMDDEDYYFDTETFELFKNISYVKSYK